MLKLLKVKYAISLMCEISDALKNSQLVLLNKIVIHISHQFEKKIHNIDYFSISIGSTR